MNDILVGNHCRCAVDPRKSSR